MDTTRFIGGRAVRSRNKEFGTTWMAMVCTCSSQQDWVLLSDLPVHAEWEDAMACC